MKVQEIFERDIFRNINPAVVVSDKKSDTIDAEIREYIFTDELIEKIFEMVDTVLNKKSGKSDSAEDLSAELKKKKDSDVKSNEKSISKKEAEKGSLEDGDKHKKKLTKKEPKESKDPKENSGNKNFL